jgi:hypothetical protein
MSIQIVNYSEKSIAVLGDSKPIKDHLVAIGGKFNPSLTWKEERVSGWIFVASKKEEVKKVLLSYADGSLGDAPVREKKEYRGNDLKSSGDSFSFSKEMYLALVSRIERLENEVAILKKVSGKIESKPVVKKVSNLNVSSNIKFTEDDDVDLNTSDLSDEDEKKNVKSLFKKK